MATLTALGLLLSGCNAAQQEPAPPAASQLEWSKIEDEGIAPDVSFALTLTSPAMTPDAVGFLVLIREDGSTRFLKTGPHGDANLASGSGRICTTSETMTYELDSSTALRWKRGGYAGSSAWTAATNAQSCIVVLNSGVGPSGYETDVYWGSGTQQRHSVVPDVPGPIGIYDDSIWVRNAAIAKIPGRLTLFRTDLKSGRTERFMTWPTYSERAAGSSPANFDDGYGSNLFSHDQRLYYLEDLLAVSKRGEQAEVKPGIRGELRLAEIDPATKTQRSWFLQYNEDGLLGDGGNVIPAAAARGGHLDDGTLYTIDATGRILAVAIARKQLRVVGNISERAAQAKHMAAAWHGDQLTLIFTTSTEKVALETYDLKTGKLRSQLDDIAGVGKLLQDGLDFGTAAQID